MSCNGCRVLRKGCNDSCILRPCLQWIENSEAQGYATVFLAKFFGRAGLMGFISAVSEDQRPALFQSLLYDACGRTVNPVFGAVGLLWSGNWQICQAAVDTVLKGGSLRLMSPPSSLSANLSYSALYSRAFSMPENLPVSSAGRVADPITAVFPLSSNMPADTSLDPFTMNLGIRLPKDKDLEPAEKTYNVRPGKANNDSHLGATSKRNVESFSKWQKDGRCESRIQLHTDCRRDGFEQELYELNRTGVPFQGACAAPRSVRARVEPRPVAPLGSKGQSGDFSVLAHEAEQLELDLTLTVKGGKGDKVVGSKRLTSPSCSVISEGSVTSLDCTLREPLKPPCSWASDKSFLQPHFRTLLPLLQ